jgi:hypothetical protein
MGQMADAMSLFLIEHGLANSPLPSLPSPLSLGVIVHVRGFLARVMHEVSVEIEGADRELVILRQLVEVKEMVAE